MASLILEQRRGFAVEGVHEIDAVACDASGRVVATVGVDQLGTFRSSAKPFQLEISLSALTAVQRATLEPEDLALGAASHHGEPAHIARVEALMRKLSREPRHLYCGAHAPSHGPSAQALWASGQVPSVLHNNCSGKHTFMAAACAAQGWEEDYLAPSHPLQRQVLTRLSERCGSRVEGTVVDGCGLPCFVLPLSAMAQAWAQVAVAMGSKASPSDDALGRIGRAMRAHPTMMSGSEAFDGWLINNAPVLAKVGAQGLLCVALPEQGIGAAIKIRSGADAVRPVAAWALLNTWFPGLLSGELPAQFSVVTNVVGKAVGDVHARWVSG